MLLWFVVLSGVMVLLVIGVICAVMQPDDFELSLVKYDQFTTRD